MAEWAAQTINKSFWAGAYYRQQRNKGCFASNCVRALAFKWIRILYSLLAKSYSIRRVKIFERIEAPGFTPA